MFNGSKVFKEYEYGCAASDFFYWEDAGDKTRGECYEQNDRED